MFFKKIKDKYNTHGCVTIYMGYTNIYEGHMQGHVKSPKKI